MNTTAFVGACILALGAPFELTTPIVRLPWQSVSNLELLFAGVCGAWLVSILVSRSAPAWRTPLTAPWLALLAAMFIAAVVAPSDRVNALHMTARLTAGAIVFLMTVDGIRTPVRLCRAMLAALVSGALVAMLAVLEYFRMPLVLQGLRMFRPGLALVGAQVRAGGPLAYPTIASMYLEIVFAFGLGLLLTAVDADRRTYARATFIALVVIAYAVTLTFTRAGLATIAVSLAIVGVARYVRRGAERGTRAVTWLAVVIVLIVATSRSTQAMWLRMTSEGQGDWYRSVVEAPGEIAIDAGASTIVPVRVTNLGRVTWDSTDDPPFFLAYHWLKADGTRVVSFEGVRTPFPNPVPAGTSASLDARVWAPSQAGEFRLEWDLVQEQRLWFNTEPDANPPTVTVTRVTGIAPPAGSQPTFPLPKRSVRPGRLTLWRIAAGMFASHPIFGIGPDNFRLEYGDAAGLANADTRTHSNSMYIEMFVGGGIVGGIAFLWLMGSAAKLSAGAVRRFADARLAPALGATAAIAAVLVHGFVDSFFSFTPAYIVIAFTLGLAVASTCGTGAGTHADCV